MSFAEENRRLWELEGEALAAQMRLESEAKYGLPAGEESK